MAKVLIQRVFPDGDSLTVQINAETSYPDALAEAKATAIAAFTEATGIILAAVEDE